MSFNKKVYVCKLVLCKLSDFCIYILYAMLVTKNCLRSR